MEIFCKKKAIPSFVWTKLLMMKMEASLLTPSPRASDSENAFVFSLTVSMENYEEESPNTFSCSSASIIRFRSLEL